MLFRQHHVSHGHGHHQIGSGGGGGGVYGGGGSRNNSIFDNDGPSFGNTFGGVSEQGSMRMPSSQVNQNLSRETLQVGNPNFRWLRHTKNATDFVQALVHRGH